MSEAILTPLLLTFEIAAIATALALFFGVALAALLARGKGFLRDLIEAILTLPLVLPPTVLGYYLLVLLGREGFVGAWLQQFGIHLIFTTTGAVMAASVVAFPMVLRAARAAFADVDPQLESAARTLGANPLAVFLGITLPLAWRGVMAGALLAFARATGEFGATLMVAGSLPGRTQTLSIAIYEAVMAGDDTQAHTLVLVALASSFLILLLAAQLLQRAPRQRGT
jgi:molybdate transport system permease protein